MDDNPSLDDTQVSEVTQRQKPVRRPAPDDPTPPQGIEPPQVEPEPPAPPRAAYRRPPGYLLLWILTTASLLINVVLLWMALQARDLARNAILDAVAVLDSLQEESLAYTVRIEDTLIIETDLPVDETIPVIIDQTLPINTPVTVVFDVPLLGEQPVTAPVIAEVPIYFEQDVRINQPFHVRAAVPLELNIPIELNVSDLGLDSTIEETQARLTSLADLLDTPLIMGSPR